MKVVDVVGTPFCVSPEEGHVLHNVIYDKIANNEEVTVSFDGVRRLTTLFLNAAIGQLYNEFDETHIQTYLRVPPETDIKTKRLIKKATDGAKDFYKNQSNDADGLNDD